MGASMAYLCTPFFVYKVGWGDAPGAHGVMGLIVGGFFIEAFELIVALTDELQANPKIIIAIIKKRFLNEKEVQRKERQRDEDDPEGSKD
jgi:hypothetical protein